MIECTEAKAHKMPRKNRSSRQQERQQVVNQTRRQNPVKPVNPVKPPYNPGPNTVTKVKGTAYRGDQQQKL